MAIHIWSCTYEYILGMEVVQRLWERHQGLDCWLRKSINAPLNLQNRCRWYVCWCRSDVKRFLDPFAVLKSSSLEFDRAIIGLFFSAVRRIADRDCSSFPVSLRRFLGLSYRWAFQEACGFVFRHMSYGAGLYAQFVLAKRNTRTSALGKINWNLDQKSEEISTRAMSIQYHLLIFSLCALTANSGCSISQLWKFCQKESY